MWFCDSQDRVFYSTLDLLPHTLVWQPADFQASHIASCGSVFWRLHNHSVFCLVKEEDSTFPGPSSSSSRWMKICDNVASISVGEDCGWIVRLDGGLVCHKVGWQEPLLVDRIDVSRALTGSRAPASRPGSSTPACSSPMSCSGRAGGSSSNRTFPALLYLLHYTMLCGTCTPCTSLPPCVQSPRPGGRHRPPPALLPGTPRGRVVMDGGQGE